MTFTLNIDMDKRCPECGKMGAVGDGICLKCSVKAMSDKPMKSKTGQAAQKRFKEIINK